MSIADPALSPRQSRELLANLSDLRRVGRRAPGAPWLPLQLFGGLTTFSAAVAATAGVPWLGPYWILSGVFVFAVLVRHQSRRSAGIGIFAGAFVKVRKTA